ncbi:hypothetical protein V8E36_003893 [Tilletia maclaganii]
MIRSIRGWPMRPFPAAAIARFVDAVAVISSTSYFPGTTRPLPRILSFQRVHSEHDSASRAPASGARGSQPHDAPKLYTVSGMSMDDAASTAYKTRYSPCIQQSPYTPNFGPSATRKAWPSGNPTILLDTTAVELRTKSDIAVLLAKG